MATKLMKRLFAPTAVALLSAFAFSGSARGAQKPVALEHRHVAARGQLTGTRESLRVVTWQTANPANGPLPYARAHFSIETSGPRPRVLFEADGGDTQYLVDSIQTVVFDSNTPPAILSLWWEGASAGAVLRVFRWDATKQSFVELRCDADLAGVRRYRVTKAARPRIIVSRSSLTATGQLSQEDVAYAVRGFELVRIGGGGGVSANSESGIEGRTVISPTRPGPVRVGDTQMEAPYPALLVVTLVASGREVTRLKTGADGHFRIVLPPGEYRIVATSDRPGRSLPRGSEEVVEVVAGRFASVTIHFDSGMR